jgi:hypothetical protein
MSSDRTSNIRAKSTWGTSSAYALTKDIGRYLDSASVGAVTNIIEALRRLGGATQKSALERQDQYLNDKIVESRHREVARSPSGTAETFVATVAPTPEDLRPMNAEEMQAVIDSSALVDRFFESFLGHTPPSWGVEQLDAAFACWARATERMGYDDEAVVQILGAAFGQLCVRTVHMTWVVIKDSDGTAAALRGTHKDYRAFPFHSIRKRIRDSEEGFFRSIYITLEDAAASDRFASIE